MVHGWLRMLVRSLPSLLGAAPRTCQNCLETVPNPSLTLTRSPAPSGVFNLRLISAGNPQQLDAVEGHDADARSSAHGQSARPRRSRQSLKTGQASSLPALAHSSSLTTTTTSTADQSRLRGWPPTVPIAASRASTGANPGRRSPSSGVHGTQCLMSCPRSHLLPSLSCLGRLSAAGHGIPARTMSQKRSRTSRGRCPQFGTTTPSIPCRPRSECQRRLPLPSRSRARSGSQTSGVCIAIHPCFGPC